MSRIHRQRTPALETSVSRVIDGAIFPTSPAATLREAIFSEILARVLGADPSIGSLDEFYELVNDHVEFDAEKDYQNAIDVFESTYTTTGERGARGKKAKRYIVPFHPAVAECIKPEETRNWGKWYQMLMTTEEEGFNRRLHERFVERLRELDTSNLFEEVFVNVAREHAAEQTESTQLEPIRPYINDSSRVFQRDLDAWLRDDVDSPSNWLQSTRDLFCFHFMMYYINLAVNLRREFESVAGEEVEFEPEIVDTHFGLWAERATGDRRFAGEWRERSGVGIERDIYDSWGRLAVLNVISETVGGESNGGNLDTVTLTEAIQLPEKTRMRCVKAIESHFAEPSRRPESDLVTSAQRLATAVREDYEDRSRSNQTPITMGINVVRQLGDGSDRRFWRTQRKIGPTLRINRSALRFLARLFTLGHDDVHFDRFISYLERRGVYFDTQSETRALKELEEMGMIDRQSDSGGAVYVRSI